MMKLPNVYANKIDKVIKNNEDYYHGDRNENVSKKDISELRKYFDRNGYANKLVVSISTKNGKSVEKLILCKENYVVNINNKKIYFNDIVDFEVK